MFRRRHNPFDPPERSGGMLLPVLKIVAFLLSLFIGWLQFGGDRPRRPFFPLRHDVQPASLEQAGNCAGKKTTVDHTVHAGTAPAFTAKYTPDGERVLSNDSGW